MGCNIMASMPPSLFWGTDLLSLRDHVLIQEGLLAPLGGWHLIEFGKGKGFGGI